MRAIADVSDESDTEIKEQSDTNVDSDPEVAYGLKSDQVSLIKAPCMTFKINDIGIKALIDTG